MLGLPFGVHTFQLWLVALWHVRSCFPYQGSNPHPLHWKADSLPLDLMINSVSSPLFPLQK